MHYNIVLLPKKVTNCITYLLFKAMRYVTFALLFVIWPACLFLILKILFLANVKALSHQK